VPFGGSLLSFGWRDLLEIALVAFVLYRGLLLISGTRALQMLAGIVVLVLAYAAAWVLKLTMLTWVLGLAFTYGAFAALVIFQPELRAALANLGRRRLGWLMRRDEATTDAAGVLADTAFRLARRSWGAIIAVERDVSLRPLLQTGTVLAATVNAELLVSLFAHSSPLHDGAVIVRGDQIVGAGCILPLSSAPLDRNLGTRHRAAIGLSEETDAVVIVVSEEREVVSVVVDGGLRRVGSERELRTFLVAREGGRR
jgi:diadenylate cyclase